MVKLDFYAIFVDIDERRYKCVELFYTFEECMQNRMKYANWCRPQGDIWIKHFSGGHNLTANEEWHIDSDGHIVNHYVWEKRNETVD